MKAIVTNTTDEGFLDYSCIAFGVAFASVDNIIYYNIEDDGRILDHKDAIADALALNPQALEFNPDPRISNKHFHFEFSENLKELADVGYNPPGDFWIFPVPSLNPPFTITLSLTDTQGIVAGPLEYGFSPSNLDCSEGDSSGGDTPGPITPTPTNTPRPPP